MLTAKIFLSQFSQEPLAISIERARPSTVSCCCPGEKRKREKRKERERKRSKKSPKVEEKRREPKKVENFFDSKTFLEPPGIRVAPSRVLGLDQGSVNKVGTRRVPVPFEQELNPCVKKEGLFWPLKRS